MEVKKVRITGVGHAVGSGVRTNDDPVFDWLRRHNVENKGLFTGYKDRAVLLPDEDLDDIMVKAAQNALDDAGILAGDVDVFTGYGSISRYMTPNTLANVHHRLGMSDDCWLLPVQSEYTNFIAGIWIANSLIGTGNVQNVLVCCGCNWTRYVDYHQAAAISVGDGASAALVSACDDKQNFHVKDMATRCDTRWYGAMDMSPREMLADDTPSALSPFARLGAYTKPVFNLDPERGGKAFKEFGEKAPPKLALALIEKNGLTPDDVTVISHQASGVLLDAWREAIKPKRYLDTMAKYGNMTLASVGVTLSDCYDDIDTRYVVLLGIGIQQETSALLLERG